MARGESHGVVDMEEKFCSVSLDIIGRAVFNFEFHSSTSESPIVKAVYRLLKEARDRRRRRRQRERSSISIDRSSFRALLVSPHFQESTRPPGVRSRARAAPALGLGSRRLPSRHLVDAAGRAPHDCTAAGLGPAVRRQDLRLAGR